MCAGIRSLVLKDVRTVRDMENLTFSGESVYRPRRIRVVAADDLRGRSVQKLPNNVQKVYADANQR